MVFPTREKPEPRPCPEPPNRDDLVSIKMELTLEDIEHIDWIAKLRNLNRTDALRHAIRLEVFLRSLAADGKKILIADGETISEFKVDPVGESQTDQD